ncbi:hypothetical protein V8C42DRAFT_312387 [Trichoderma barbatum]
MTASIVSSSGIFHRMTTEPLRYSGSFRQPQPNSPSTPSIHMPSFDAWLVAFGSSTPKTPQNPTSVPLRISTAAPSLEKRPAQSPYPGGRPAA